MNHKLSWSLIIADALLHFIPIFSQVFDEYRIYDQWLACFVRIQIDDPQ